MRHIGSSCHAAAVRYSTRLPADLTPSALARQLEAATAIDLTISNPTRVALAYDVARLHAALAHAEVCAYDPQPLGLASTRGAVARYLAGLGRRSGPERIALTASTSEAYGTLFKLLCDPGDAVAVPAPSYPLVPHLAELEGAVSAPYRLVYDERWRLDFESLAAVLAAGARAVVVVNPNNPTGHGLADAERRELRALCRRHDAAIIADEVFAPYGCKGPLASLGEDGGPLTFVLDGLSKAAALPQLKLGWISVFGVEAEVGAALGRLEWLLDAYLSVNAPVQLAAAELLAAAPAMQAQINARLARNRAALRAALATSGCRLLPSDGGWYAVVALPAGVGEEEVVAALAVRDGVRVQPGYFYDFADEGFLVMSLLVDPPTFTRGAGIVARRLRDL